MLIAVRHAGGGNQAVNTGLKLQPAFLSVKAESLIIQRGKTHSLQLSDGPGLEIDPFSAVLRLKSQPCLPACRLPALCLLLLSGYAESVTSQVFRFLCHPVQPGRDTQSPADRRKQDFPA